MLNYTAPLRDLHFVLNDVLDAPGVLSRLPRYAEIDTETLDAVAESAGNFAAERVLPLNQSADQVGCQWIDGKVQVPPGFVEAYAAYCDLGWPSVCADQEHGGQALPRTAFSIVNEFQAAASHSFVMYSAVNHCAAACLRHSASPELKDAWLGGLSSGRVMSSMCMSEPQAGSDIGLATTKAVLDTAGRYRITGTKIFASGGDHELTPNIAHLVLARMPDAPTGSRGLSLFLVPKRLDDGNSNGVQCQGIEHKMGLHGSATCVLRFESALGWLVGEPDRGLRALFPMMNEARLLSGLQAVGLSEIALQNSLNYARDRRQGRSPTGRSPCPLIEHPDVQRMLLSQKAWTEGGRAFVHWTSLLIDIAEWHPTAFERERAGRLLSLLTPIVKGFLTENAQQSVGLALQVFGGHGYIAETGIEQLVRDVRVTTIYEGTTGIQAQDLLLRKVLGSTPTGLDLLLANVQVWLDGVGSSADLSEFRSPLVELMEGVRTVTAALAQREALSPAACLASCTNYLRLLGHLVFAFLWAQMAAAAIPRATMGDAWCSAKLTTARFYFSQMLPETSQVLRALDAQPVDWAQGLISD